MTERAEGRGSKRLKRKKAVKRAALPDELENPGDLWRAGDSTPWTRCEACTGTASALSRTSRAGETAKAQEAKAQR